jgi:acyl transferase domain-containing protein
MEAGIDSLAATELSMQLRALTGVALPATLVFEQPTARAIADHMHGRAAAPSAAPSAALGRTPAGSGATTAVAVVGSASRWPGSNSSERAYEQLQAACGDAIGRVPATRWSTSEAPSVPHGGFVLGAELLDISAFGLSEAEASAMDPQQRLVLELGYDALHGASERRASLLGSDGGVCVGIERPDWALVQPPSVRGTMYAATGDNVSVASGRLSYVLGLHGPCSSVDTACSSALVAVQCATHAVCLSECRWAVAAAVSLKLSPHGALIASQAGMLSAGGRCKTLDAAADGYVRSEGVGALVLSRGDARSIAVLCGCAVRQTVGRRA